MDKDFANAVQRELRTPVRKAANELKSAARSNLTLYSGMGAAAASGIRASTSYKGYLIKRERNSRFSQHGSTDKLGVVRHPLYGNRNYWYDTPMGAQGWWTKTVEEVIPPAIEEFQEAVWRVVQRLANNDLSVNRTYRTIGSGVNAGKTTYTSSL